MLAAARDLGMEPLVETHSDEDLERALATDARIVGVNARDLETLEVDVAAARIAARADPATGSRCSKAGSVPAQTSRRAVAAGASAILVGETLMRAADPGAATARALLGREERSA